MKHNDILDETYVRLFVLVPLLVYTGTCIMLDRSHTSTIMFHFIVVAMIALMLFYHIRYITKHLRRIFLKQRYQKEFGVFLLMLAVFFLIVGLRDLSHQT